jgi:hypothetical protein
MVIVLDPELEAALNKRASEQGISPETLVLEALRRQFVARASPGNSSDEWVRRLRAVATDCGVALSDEAVSSEGIYQ